MWLSYDYYHNIMRTEFSTTSEKAKERNGEYQSFSPFKRADICVL